MRQPQQRARRRLTRRQWLGLVNLFVVLPVGLSLVGGWTMLWHAALFVLVPLGGVVLFLSFLGISVRR